ncbi:hypothetical protein SAMN05216276_101472 [Streptosporangium subroseum]|jgi:hypothetical protein|uniref:DUF2470 domain-containing protein n=1 Tax=Streptosporangium subroseum TaxID=106412 RepID=A0A239GMU7_9ACTN|nr:DUF2470 domain-containing protein [Streptosporangium subroseum]SNS70519.1 hypothetical protein SAMN05216276_101472 [Streptosporangium subroseum]
MPHPVTAAPTPERVRTLAATAAPTHVSLVGTSRPAMPAKGGVDGAGRPVLLVLPEDPLYGISDESVVTVDLTASRSLGDHELSRGLLKVQGWVQAVPADEARETTVAIAERCPDEALFEALETLETATGPRLLRVDVGRVIYLTGPESGVLDAEEYLDATPDPLWGEAERMLHHVNNAHRGQLETALGSLLSAPVTEAWLWELDRFGATVRSGIDDPTLIRLPWPAPITDARSLEHAVRCLLCHH